MAGLLRESRAGRDYTCGNCGEIIRRGQTYSRDEPHPLAHWHRGLQVEYFCYVCVVPLPLPDTPLVINQPLQSGTRGRNDRQLPLGEAPLLLDPAAGHGSLFDWAQARLARTIRVELLQPAPDLVSRLIIDPEEVYRFSPEEFESLVCGRFEAMGFDVRQVGATNRKDGGIDILFWPRRDFAVPFLGAAQVKHHRHPTRTTEVGAIRNFAGAIGGQLINLGFVVTNTTFTPDAAWYAEQHKGLIRLRDHEDLRRWIHNRFTEGEGMARDAAIPPAGTRCADRDSIA